ncbi:hypothetical protein KBD45_06795 [Candidatus Dojkabacteria bacterium]|nr:hypothetical protein [Candidatus Dojkabacteria bacterium]
METEIAQLKKEIDEIKARNRKVELEKTWETSFLRKISVAGLTYLVMTIFMWSLEVEKPYLNAIIPTLGFVLSTLSLPFIKAVWLRNRKA